MPNYSLLEIRKQIHTERVVLVQTMIVQHSNGLFGIRLILVLQKGVPLCIAILVDRIELLVDSANGGEQLLDDGAQLGLACRRHLWDVVHNNNTLDAIGFAGFLGQQIAQQLYNIMNFIKIYNNKICVIEIPTQ